MKCKNNWKNPKLNWKILTFKLRILSVNIIELEVNITKNFYAFTILNFTIKNK